jgi:hypothetical protein
MYERGGYSKSIVFIAQTNYCQIKQATRLPCRKTGRVQIVCMFPSKTAFDNTVSNVRLNAPFPTHVHYLIHSQDRCIAPIYNENSLVDPLAQSNIVCPVARPLELRKMYNLDRL